MKENIEKYKNVDACAYTNNSVVVDMNMYINFSLAFFQFRGIKETTKLPIFYFDYQEHETYPEKPEDLDFKKLKRMTNAFKKLGKYILIFGDKHDGEIKKLLTGDNGFYQNRNADDWSGVKHDESGKIVTNDLIKMNLHIRGFSSATNLLWKPLLPLHKDFLPDDYETTLKNFSETNNKQ